MTERNKEFWLDEDRWTGLRDRINSRTAPFRPLQPPAPVKGSATPNPTSPQAKKIEVSLKLTLPHISAEKIKQSIRHAISKLKLILPGLLRWKYIAPLALLLVLNFGARAYQHFKLASSQKAPSSVTEEKKAEAPSYTPIIPQADEATKPQIGYDAERKVASFKDKIGEVPITVSQQPLPENFKTNPAQQLENAAKSFSANDSVVADGTKAYIGTSIKGPQSVILYKNDLLIFIQSAQMITKEQWTAYIKNLK